MFDISNFLSDEFLTNTFYQKKLLMFFYFRSLPTRPNPNDIVLDPFLGGGTTGISAILSGRKFIGADIEQKCLDTTLERVKESYGSSERENGLA